MISDGKKIAMNYLKGRLIIDILASLPLEQIVGMFSTGISKRQGDFLSLLKITRLLRLGRMISYFQIN